jgi:hypothetical protein
MRRAFWRLLYHIWVQIGPEAPEGVYLARQYKRRASLRTDPQVRDAYQRYYTHPLVRGYSPYQWG